MRGLRKGISRNELKGGGGQAHQNNPGKDLLKYICDKIALKKTWLNPSIMNFNVKSFCSAFIF